MVLTVDPETELDGLRCIERLSMVITALHGYFQKTVPILKQRIVQSGRQ